MGIEWFGVRNARSTHSALTLPVRSRQLAVSAVVVRRLFVVPSFLRSFVPPFLRSFVLSFIRSFVHSFIRSFVRSFIRHSFVRSFVIRSFVRSFVRCLFLRSTTLHCSCMYSYSIHYTHLLFASWFVGCCEQVTRW